MSSTIDGGMANMPDDMNALARAVSSMAAALEILVSEFPRDGEGKVPPELLRTSTKLSIVHAGNTIEAALNQTRTELAWARAKVLAWAAAEAQWKAEQA